MPQDAMISEVYTASRRYLHVATGRLLIHDDEKLKRWKEHFTMVFNHIISGEVSPLVDEMASHRNMRILTVPPSKRELTTITAPAISADLLLPLVRKSWESEHILREWKKRMMIKIPKNRPHFECVN